MLKYVSTTGLEIPKEILAFDLDNLNCPWRTERDIYPVHALHQEGPSSALEGISWDPGRFRGSVE